MSAPLVPAIIGKIFGGDGHLTRRGRRYRRERRGYPLAVLIGFEDRRAVLWRVFSEVVKPGGTVESGGELYDFNESIVDALRPAFREGVRSVVLVAPRRTDYVRSFLDHIRRHHSWLVREDPNAATFGELVGSARRPHEVHELVRTKAFREMMSETRSRDGEGISAILEKSLRSDKSETVVSYSLEQIEYLVHGRQEHNGLRPEHIVLTDKYLADTRTRGRVLRLLQISKNNGIKTTIVDAETRPGIRLTQLGGLVCFAKSRRKRRSAAW